MACHLEIEGRVATLRTVVREPEIEGFMLERAEQFAEEIEGEIEDLVADRFGSQLRVSHVSIEPAGSIAVLVVLSTLGQLVIEFGALMAGLRELSRLLPNRIRSILRRRFDAPRRVTVRGVLEPAEVVLGPSVLSPTHPRSQLVPGERVAGLEIALSALGGATLVIAGMLLGHFL